MRTANLYTLSVQLLVVITAVMSHGDHFHVDDGGLEDWDDDDDPEVDDWEPENVIQRDKFVHNVEHMKAHMKDDHVVMDTQDMSPGEKDYHFFDEHDENLDDKLDGLELLHAILEGLDEQFDKLENEDEILRHKKQQMLYTKAWLSVDRILRDGDKNNDGYISYTEFKSIRTIALNNPQYQNKAQKGKRPEDTKHIKI